MIPATGRTGAGVAVVLALVILVPATVLILRRRDPVGVLLAVVAAAVATASAGLMAVVTRTPARFWLIGVVPTVYLLGILRARTASAVEAEDRTSWRTAAITTAFVAAPASAFVLRAPALWDARSIWFFHASWFASPGVAYTDLAGHDPFSHPDYPPLAPAFGAFAWLFGNDRNDWIPQMATAAMTASGVVVLALAIGRLATTVRATRWVAIAVVVLFIAVTGGNGFDGYVDGTAAVFVAILVISALVPAPDRHTVVVAALAAALIKNEAFLFLVLVIVPLHLFRRRSLLPLLPGVALGAVWAVAVRLPGPELESWQATNALPWSATFWDRLTTTVQAVTDDRTLVVAVVLWFGAALLVRATPVRQAQALITGSGLAAAALLGLIVTMYLASPSAGPTGRGLEWHLGSSVDRLLIHPSLVLGVGAVAALASGAWRRPPRDETRGQEPMSTISPEK